MILLPLSGTPDEDGMFRPRPNPHDPFEGVIPGAYWQRLLRDGFAYACTLELHYPVHVVLRRDSPRFDALRAALETSAARHLPPTGQGALEVEGPDFRVSIPPL
jgi:hypothetical protein